MVRLSPAPRLSARASRLRRASCLTRPSACSQTSQLHASGIPRSGKMLVRRRAVFLFLNTIQQLTVCLSMPDRRR